MCNEPCVHVKHADGRPHNPALHFPSCSGHIDPLALVWKIVAGMYPRSTDTAANDQFIPIDLSHLRGFALDFLPFVRMYELHMLDSLSRRHARDSIDLSGNIITCLCLPAPLFMTSHGPGWLINSLLISDIANCS